jgi:hypothetical protein
MYNAIVAILTCAATACGRVRGCVAGERELQRDVFHLCRISMDPPTILEEGIPSVGENLPLKLSERMNGPDSKQGVNWVWWQSQIGWTVDAPTWRALAALKGAGSRRVNNMTSVGGAIMKLH